MNLINKKNINELLNKLLDDTLSDNEKEHLRTYISSTYKDEQLDDLMFRHWENMKLSAFAAEPSLENVRTKLWALIQKEQCAQKQLETKHKIRWQVYVIRIAAVLLIPLLVYTGFLFDQVHGNREQAELVLQQVVANPGSRVHFTLPDQTEVWLNSGSTLEYPAAMNSQKQRNVKLIGQGYFKVAHNPNCPFWVEADQLKIKVMGTSFDVSNYKNDGQITSTLEEGSIALFDSQDRKVAVLEPGQQATLKKDSRELHIENIETELITSWKDGRLIFRNSSIPEIITRLERWFNCSIEADVSLVNSDIEYTATIQDETLGEVLQMIELSTAVKTSIKNRKVRIWAK